MRLRRLIHGLFPVSFMAVDGTNYEADPQRDTHNDNNRTSINTFPADR